MARTFAPPPHVAIQLVGRSSARTARRAVTELLSSAVAADWHADAALVVSELIANALEASGECHLSAWYLHDEHVLRAEVTDRSPELPIAQLPDSTRVGGHGLRIVEALSARWGVTVAEDSKTVWFEIDG